MAEKTVDSFQFTRRSADGGSMLSPEEQASIVAGIEAIEDPEEKKRAITKVPDATLRRDLIAVHIRLFKPEPERAPRRELEPGTAYRAIDLPDGSTVYEPMSDEERRRAHKAAILAMPPGSERRRAIAENIDLFR